MVEKGNTKLFVRKILPKVFKAALLAVITYLPMYFLSSLINPIISPIKPFFPWYEQVTNIFAAVFIFFLVVGVLFSGTVFQYVFGVARALVLMVFFICVLNGGIITLTVPTEGASVNIMLDVTVVLAMLVLVCLLGIAKNVVQAIDFVSSKAEIEEL
jgi:hypothetical protein